MPYTIKPEERHAKVYGSGSRVSTKKAMKICRLIRGKKLTVVRRLLENLSERKRDIDGKYYSKAVKEMLKLLKSCEKNADHLGLDKRKLFVHASAHVGSNLRRRRRKAKFGSRMKNTNLEIFLIERG